MKKERIEQIDSIDKLAALVSQLLNKINLKNIKRVSSNVIEAKEISSLKERKTFFILTLSELNGKTPQIQERVNEIKSNADNLYIVTSNRKQSKYFKEWLRNSCNYNNIDFWARDKIVELVDAHLASYWAHNDPFMQEYEENFLENIENDKELKKLLKLDDKFDNLLNIFIEPKIFELTEDKETQKPTKKKIDLDSLLDNKNYILSGDAGTGKSTILKELGKRIIYRNRMDDKKSIPILINSNELVQCEFNVKEVIAFEIESNFSEHGIEKVNRDYHINLLIDSIDEFEKPIRENILNDLSEIGKEENFNFLLCTRNYESLTSDCNICEHSNPFLVNFDLKQVKKYLDDFFRFDLSKSNELWEILNENNTLEKVPITPLTISLISILYEDKGYEIPATITDVYDNFSLFLLGKLTVENRFEFLNINVKKRILSNYALSIIESENRVKKKVDDFIKYIVDFFSAKSITIDDDTLPELIGSLTDGTGILYIDENNYVSFKHDHFMEYYASIEIFDHHRNDYENKLISRFNDFNWQNTAIFYAGRTKDMPSFLKMLIEHIGSYQLLNDCYLGISGMGYILQSLWMTDSTIRKEGVKTALNLLIKADAEVKRFAASKIPFFQNIKHPDIAIMNLVWFYKHFNSVALKDPLSLAFEDIHQELSFTKSSEFMSDSNTLFYKLFCIGATLDTGRNADPEKLRILFEKDNILTKPLFVLLFEAGLEVLETENRLTLNEDFKTKKRIRKYSDSIKFYLDTPSEDLRYTTFDSITPPKKIELYTEGKSDAKIITHAFSVLTGNKDPFWKISSCETPLKSNSGGASNLANLLVQLSKNIKTKYDKEKIVVGIFDNDAKGCQEFGGLKEDFVYVDPRTRKHENLNIYAIKLPIPPYEEYDSYNQEKEAFKFFEIEHYFPLTFLKKEKMVSLTSIPNVFEIKDKKSKFADNISTHDDPQLFRNFSVLFREIDEIAGIEINYIE